MGVPIYMRIQQFIKAKIASGEWGAGFLIPTEAELSREFGCSRITVTTALRELVKDGLIYRIQGKGTYVSERSASSNLYERADLAQAALSLEAMSIPGEHRCEEVRVENPSEEVAKILGLEPEQKTISIVRLKYVEGAPFSVETVFLPELQYLPVLEEHLEDQPFRKISEVCGISVGKSFISSEPVLCPAEAGKLLGVPAGAPVLKFCIEIYDTRENPTACEILYTRGKQTKVQLT